MPEPPLANGLSALPDPESDRGPMAASVQTAPDGCHTPHQTCKELYRKYVSLFDFAPIGYLVIDGEDLIQELNLSAAVCLNAPRTQLTGHHLTDFIHQEDLDSYYRQKGTCRDNLETAKFELKMRRMDGFFFDAQLQMQTVSSRGTDIPRYSVAIVDISEHVQLSSSFALQQKCLEIACQAKGMQALLDGFVQAVKGYLKCEAVGIRVRDDRGNIPYQSYDGFSQGFYRSESPLSLHTDQCLCVDVIKGESNLDSAYQTAKGSFYINGTTRFLRGLPADRRGRVRHVCNKHGYESIALVPIRVDAAIEGLIHAVDQRENYFPLRLVEALEDVSQRLGLAMQRFHLEQKLRESVISLNALSSHLLSVQEDEQRRIALELHDGCGQDLNVLKLRLKIIRDHCPTERTDLTHDCDALLRYADKIINDIRSIAHNLKPATLDALGLTIATRQMASEFSASTAIPVSTDIDLLDGITSSKDQLCLFRIFQEALLNVHKHAQATRVWIKVRRERGNLRTEIRDNGKGFDVPKSSPPNHSPQGMGLSALALRCRMIAAKLSIDSRPGKGTRLIIRLPLPVEGENHG